jgi:hypothetical protein
MGIQQLVAVVRGRGRRRVGGGVVEVDAGARHGGRVRICPWVGWGSIDLVGHGGGDGAGRRLGAVVSTGFLRSPWAAVAAVVGKAGGSKEGEGEARRRGSGQREEAEGRRRQWNRVWGSFYTKQTQF